jgi:hypothetical protein
VRTLDSSSAPSWWRWLGIACFASVAPLVALIIAVGRVDGPAAVLSTALPAVLMPACGVLLVTARVSIAADAEGLVVRFHPIWARRVVLAEISNLHVQRVSFLTYGGLGLRFTLGTTALVMRPGPAVAIVLTNGRRFVVQSSDAVALCSTIRSMIQS